MEILIALAIVWLLWLTSSKQWKERFIRPLAVVLILSIIVSSSIFINFLMRGLTIAVPPDSGDRVDTIVVLGRGPDQRESRLVEALQLWENERASSIFVSGMMDAKPMVRYLKDTGIPISSLAGEECSQTTEENGLFASAILRPQGVEDILLVTDQAHMWRSLLVFRSVDFRVVPRVVRLDFKQRSKLKQLYMVTREYFGLVSYALTGKFRRRSPEELDNPSSEVVQKINTWHCKDKVLKGLAK